MVGIDPTLSGPNKFSLPGETPPGARSRAGFLPVAVCACLTLAEARTFLIQERFAWEFHYTAEQSAKLIGNVRNTPMLRRLGRSEDIAGPCLMALEPRFSRKMWIIEHDGTCASAAFPVQEYEMAALQSQAQMPNARPGTCP